MSKFEIVITANSPGELWSWVRPSVTALKKEIPDSRITLILTPCQYASHKESEVAQKIPEIDRIVLPKDSFKDLDFYEKGVVLFMGGDLFFGVRLSKRLKFPALAYTQTRALWQKDYYRFLVPYEGIKERFIKKGIKKEKLTVVGNLLCDSVQSKEESSELKKPFLLFMPGSRPYQANFMLPLYEETIEILSKKLPDYHFVMALSPFFKDYKPSHPNITITTNYLSALKECDLLITIPGTNTGEAAALEKAMLVLIPLNKPELLPLDGIIGLLSEIPIIGRIINYLAIKILNRVVKYTAQPNILNKSMIVPELRGKLDGSQVAAATIKTLPQKESIEEDLKGIMGETGASQKIAEMVKELL